MTSYPHWISDVDVKGNVDVLQFMKDVYSGEEYVKPYDNDFADNQYSTLAGFDYIEVATPADLWDDSESYIRDTEILAGYLNTYPTDTLEGWGIFEDIGKGIVKGAKAGAKGVAKISGDVVYNLNEATRLPGKAIKGTLGEIPYIGKPIKDIVKLNPQEMITGLNARILKGERIDKAFLKTGKEQIAAARDVAPYVQTVMTFVPGVGTGVAAAIAAGTALADGRTITDAVIDGVRGSVPGGEIGQIAFDSAINIAKGQRVDKAAIAAARQQLPPEAQKALDAAMKLARGKDAKAVLLQAIRKELPPMAQEALDVGTAIAAGRNIQSVIIDKAISKSGLDELVKHGSAMINSSPALRKAAKGLSKPRLAGFQAAAAAIASKGINAHTLAAIRSRLKGAQQAGFDHAIKTVVNKSHPEFSSLVKGGKILRGNWVKGSGKDSVPGRIVKDGRIVKGRFKRPLTQVDAYNLAMLTPEQQQQLRALTPQQQRDLRALAESQKMRDLSPVQRGWTSALLKAKKDREDLQKLATLSPQQLQQLKNMTPAQRGLLARKQQEDLKKLAALSPQQQADLRKLATLSPQQQADLKKLAALTPEQQENLRKLAAAQGK